MQTQGNERMTETYAVAGADERPVSDGSREHGPVVEQQDGDTLDATYAAGRTVSLGDFEFVRIQIGARAGFAPGTPPDVAFEEVRAFTTEILAREEALVRKQTRENGPLPPLRGVKRLVWVEYGLTLKASVRYESHKVDIGLSRPLADGEDAAAAMEAMETYLAQRVAVERDRLRGK